MSDRLRRLLSAFATRRTLTRAAIVTVGVGVASSVAFGLPWDIDMADSQAIKAYRAPMRPLPDGVVSQPNVLSPKIFVEKHAVTDPEVAGMTSPYPQDDASLANGERMYNIYCTPCHGDGINLGPVAQPGRVPAVAVLAGPNGRLKTLSDGWVFYTIQNGSLSKIMPPYGYMMTDKEAWAIVQYVRTLPDAQHAAPTPTSGGGSAPSPVPSPGSEPK